MQLDERNFPFTVLAVTLFIFSSLNIGLQYLLQWLPEFVPTEIGITLLTLALPYVIKYMLLEQEKVAGLISKSLNIDECIRMQLLPSRNDWRNFILFGSTIPLFGLITFNIFGLPWTISFLNILFQIWLFIFLLGYGIVIGLYLFSLNSIIKIDKNCDGSKGKIFIWPINEVRDLYNSYLRLVILAALLYVGSIVSLWLIPGGSLLALQTNIGRIWVVPPAIVILVYFFAFSLKIRSFLPRWKFNAIHQINTILERESDKYFEKSSTEIYENITRLLNWRQFIQSEEIKVFDWKQILTIVGIILAPTIRVLFSPTIEKIISELEKKLSGSL